MGCNLMLLQKVVFFLAQKSDDDGGSGGDDNDAAIFTKGTCVSVFWSCLAVVIMQCISSKLVLTLLC